MHYLAHSVFCVELILATHSSFCTSFEAQGSNLRRTLSVSVSLMVSLVLQLSLWLQVQLLSPPFRLALILYYVACSAQGASLLCVELKLRLLVLLAEK